jgi:hypothetical protein
MDILCHVIMVSGSGCESGSKVEWLEVVGGCECVK